MTKGYKGSTDEIGKGKTKRGDVGNSSGKSSGSSETMADQGKMGYHHTKGYYKGYHSKSEEFSKGETDVTMGYNDSTDETGEINVHMGRDSPTSSGKGSATETWDNWGDKPATSHPTPDTSKDFIYICRWELGDRIPYCIYVFHRVPNCFTSL